MTINELRNAPPQTKQYLDAQLLNIGFPKAVNTQRGQRNVQELQVVDRQGVQEKIAYWYDVDKPDFAMPPQQVNQWLRWVVKTKPNGQYLNISGYPEHAVQPQATRPNAPTQAIIGQHRQATQLTPETQRIIDSHQPPTAGQQVMDHFGGQEPRTTKYPEPPIPTQQDYEVKEREKVLGMCFTNLLSGRLAGIPAIEIEQDKAEIAALWRLAAMCIDGTGRVQEEEEPRF